MKAQDFADLKQLVEFLREYQIAEFDLERGDLKLHLKFHQTKPSMPFSVETKSSLHVVRSPMVGAFFSSPSPGAAPFISAGDRVAKGQVLGIVEAMKLMNEIESDASGEVVKCLVSNGQPIECGQPLFFLRLG
jgi:acetyl-CoA carboxylase biotin carboxyl carrier protein